MDPRLSALYQRRSGHQDRFDAEPLMLLYRSRDGYPITDKPCTADQIETLADACPRAVGTRCRIAFEMTAVTRAAGGRGSF